MINYEFLQNEILIFYKIAFSRILDARKKSKKQVQKFQLKTAEHLRGLMLLVRNKINQGSETFGNPRKIVNIL